MGDRSSGAQDFKDEMAGADLELSEDSRLAIKAAQASFVCPPGFKLSKIPSGESRSSMYDFGVRIEQVVQHTGEGSESGRKRKIPGRFYCMASQRCRDACVAIKVSNLSTSPATEHLQGLHNVISKRSAQVQRMKTIKRFGVGSGPETRVSSPDKPTVATGSSHKRPSGNPAAAPIDRGIVLEYVKAHTILGLEPFDYLEDRDRRSTALLALTNSGGTTALVDQLDSTGIKRRVLEIYDATKGTFAQALRAEARAAAIPFAHLSIDRWHAQEDTLIGVRVSYMTKDFQARSHVLGLKPLAPAGSATDAAVGPLVRSWVGQVLGEFGLGWSAILGVVTDNSPEMRAAFQDLPGVMREPCIPRMLSRAVVDALGLSVTSGATDNKPAFDLMADVRTVLERVRRSKDAQETFPSLWKAAFEVVRGDGGVTQGVVQELARSTVAIERVLVLLPTFSQFLGAKAHEHAILESSEELLELYSLLKSVSQASEVSHHGDAPSVPSSMQRVVLLLASDLDCTKALELHEPSRYYYPSPDGDVKGDALPRELPRRRTREPGELTQAGRRTRALLRDELLKRFGVDRWGPNFESESHLFDMALALHPGCRQLQYMDKLSPNPDEAFKIKAKVFAQIQQLVEDVVVHERAAAKARRSAREGPGASSGSTGEGAGGAVAVGEKRVKLSPSANHDMVNAMASAGLFDSQFAFFDSDGDWESDNTPAEEAEDAVRTWRAAKLPASDRVINTGKGLAEFWRGPGAKRFRLVSIVARSVLGAPGCSAVASADSATSRRHFARPGRFLASAYAEMLMFLREGFDSIPKDVPSLSAEEARRAMPRRFRDSRMREQIRRLGSRPGTAGVQDFFGSATACSSCEEDCSAGEDVGEAEDEKGNGT